MGGVFLTLSEVSIVWCWMGLDHSTRKKVSYNPQEECVRNVLGKYTLLPHTIVHIPHGPHRTLGSNLEVFVRSLRIDY